MTTINGWALFPSGRWCKTLLCGNGIISLNAFVSGAWSISRQVSCEAEHCILYRSIDYGTSGTNLDEAMELAEKKAQEIFEQELPCK